MDPFPPVQSGSNGRSSIPASGCAVRDLHCERRFHGAGAAKRRPDLLQAVRQQRIQNGGHRPDPDRGEELLHQACVRSAGRDSGHR